MVFDFSDSIRTRIVGIVLDGEVFFNSCLDGMVLARKLVVTNYLDLLASEKNRARIVTKEKPLLLLGAAGSIP